MSAPHGPKWWVSRKSQLGRLTVVAREPPMRGGRAWWTEPPKIVPDLEHIEYAIAYMREIQALPGNAERHILIAHVGDWIKRARQLSHEEFGAYVAGLGTTEDLIIRADALMRKLNSIAVTKGGYMQEEKDLQLMSALSGKADQIRARKTRKP